MGVGRRRSGQNLAEKRYEAEDQRPEQNPPRDPHGLDNERRRDQPDRTAGESRMREQMDAQKRILPEVAALGLREEERRVHGREHR